MAVTMLILVDGADQEIAKQNVLKIVDPKNAVEGGEGDLKISDGTLQIEFDKADMQFMIPMCIFDGMNINFDHPAAASLLNGITVEGRKYVFLDDNVSQLAALQCRPAA